jgi:CHASE2 domain-containing sensor protein
MRIAPSPINRLKPRTGRGRILLWVTLLGLLFGSIGFGDPLDDVLRGERNTLRNHNVSGDITLVAIDNRSLSELGSFPWARRYHGLLAQQLSRMGARRIYFDVIFALRSDAQNDEAFANAVKPLGKKVILPVMLSIDRVTGNRLDLYPLPEFRQTAQLAHVNFLGDAFGLVRRMPYQLTFGGRPVPSVAEHLARASPRAGDFPIDYSLDPGSVPKVSAVDVIRGTVDPALIAGKDVIIGPTFSPYQDAFVAPSREPPIPPPAISMRCIACSEAQS